MHSNTFWNFADKKNWNKKSKIFKNKNSWKKNEWRQFLKDIWKKSLVSQKYPPASHFEYMLKWLNSQYVMYSTPQIQSPYMQFWLSLYYLFTCIWWKGIACDNKCHIGVNEFNKNYLKIQGKCEKFKTFFNNLNAFMQIKKFIIKIGDRGACKSWVFF